MTEKKTQPVHTPEKPTDDHPPGAPVAQPMPKMDGSKPVPAGKDEVEKFNVVTDTAGGD